MIETLSLAAEINRRGPIDLVCVGSRIMLRLLQDRSPSPTRKLHRSRAHPVPRALRSVPLHQLAIDQHDLGCQRMEVQRLRQCHGAQTGQQCFAQLDSHMLDPMTHFPNHLAVGSLA